MMLAAIMATLMPTSPKFTLSTAKHLLRLTSVNTTTTMFGSRKNIPLALGPNNGTTWSNNTTGTAAGTRPFTAAFDGNFSSWFQSADGLATINFSGLPAITSLEIYAGITTTSDNQFLYVNGVDKSSLFGASAAWVTVPGITSLTSHFK